MKAQSTLLVFALSAGCIGSDPSTETVDVAMAAPETATQTEAEAVSKPLILAASGEAFPEDVFPAPGNGRETSTA